MPSRIAVYAGHRDGADFGDDPRKAAPRGKRCRSGFAYGLTFIVLATGAVADPIRVATYNVGLQRDGPGLLLRDILKGEDEDVAAAASVIAHVAPDILLLTNFDYDFDGFALSAFADVLAGAGVMYPHRFTKAPNTGVPTGLDLDGDQRLGGPGDAVGYGRFRGQGGMAVLSRWPFDSAGLQDLSRMKWADLPGAIPPDGIWANQPLSTTAHWDLPVETPTYGSVRLLAFYASPPVFDGPEDRNGRRNHDEAALWQAWLDGALPGDPPTDRFVILVDANLDPVDGDGRPGALLKLLDDERVQDPKPRSDGAALAAEVQGGRNPLQNGEPRLDTADWDDERVGNLRVDYVLPSSDWDIVDAGVFWPAPDDPLSAMLEGEGATRHRLVWVDIERTDRH
ncbi:MAG: endonuclease/exonuclease/phosphatase family protein [Pseudomonadota bacterium]